MPMQYCQPIGLETLFLFFIFIPSFFRFLCDFIAFKLLDHIQVRTFACRARIVHSNYFVYIIGRSFQFDDMNRPVQWVSFTDSSFLLNPQSSSYWSAHVPRMCNCTEIVPLPSNWLTYITRKQKKKLTKKKWRRTWNENFKIYHTYHPFHLDISIQWWMSKSFHISTSMHSEQMWQFACVAQHLCHHRSYDRHQHKASQHNHRTEQAHLLQQNHSNDSCNERYENGSIMHASFHVDNIFKCNESIE